MGVEDSWATDTVALGRRRDESADLEPPGRRAPRRKLSMPTLRVIVTCVATLAVVTALSAILRDGPSSPKAPIRDIADPAPRIVVKQQTREHRRESPHVTEPQDRQKDRGEERERESKASAAPRELDVTESATEPTVELQPVPELEPTPPAVEFGM